MHINPEKQELKINLGKRTTQVKLSILWGPLGMELDSQLSGSFI